MDVWCVRTELWQFLKKTKIKVKLSCDPSVQLWSTKPQKLKSQTKIRNSSQCPQQYY